MEGIKVLLADDEQEFIETLATRLKTRGFQTATALNGDDAIALLRERDFDVVILDVVMPGKDGIETLREMKSLKPLTEVVMLSGHASLELAIKGMKFGAFDFLVKPPELTDLVDKINKAFAHKTDQEERIRKAGFVREQMKDTGAAAGPPPSSLGRLLVIGRENDFSSQLIEYALGISKRMSYQILALNAARFDNESFKLFPTAREKVCHDFRETSEKNAALFRQAAQKKGIPFSHIVKFCEQDDAIAEVGKEIGDIDYVVVESEDASARGQILTYCPM